MTAADATSATQKRATAATRSMALADLTPADYNPQRMDDDYLGRLSKSIATLGYLEHIVWNERTGNVVGGHQRLTVLLRDGFTHADVVVVDLSPEKERAANVALNRISGQFDEDALLALLSDATEDDRLLAGFTDDEFDDLEHRLHGVTMVDPPLPANAPTRVERGQVWKLGDHRIMCGDCTLENDVAAAMVGKKAAACLTDPPYQMGKDIANDQLPRGELIALHERFFTLCPVEKNATLICFHGTRAFPVALDAGRKSGWDFRRMLWLSKPNDITFPWRGWILKSEAILVFSRGKGSWNDVHPFHHDTYEFNHSGGELTDGVGHHPTVKPFEVVVDLLQRISCPGDTIFDPFLGSGTTMLAAEKLGRKCCAMEIEPKYCDVTLARWEAMTGGVAEMVT